QTSRLGSKVPKAPGPLFRRASRIWVPRTFVRILCARGRYAPTSPLARRSLTSRTTRRTTGPTTGGGPRDLPIGLMALTNSCRQISSIWPDQSSIGLNAPTQRYDDDGQELIASSHLPRSDRACSVRLRRQRGNPTQGFHRISADPNRQQARDTCAAPDDG